nr:helix-turn-helix transcriptional regulator [Bacillus toyonensis]
MKLPTKGDLIMIGNEYKNLKYKPEIKPHMLKWVRLSRNLTQSDVAVKLSVSQKMVSDYENGKVTDFSPLVYSKVCELLRAYRVDRFEIDSYRKLMEIKQRRNYRV